MPRSTDQLQPHRLVPPDQTLARLQGQLDAFGVTRCADLSRLDEDLGVVVYAAIRPRGRVLQTSAGKGLTPTAARVSALMEALELDVAERDDAAPRRRASASELGRSGRVDALPELVKAAGRFFSPELVLDWVEAEALVGGGTTWLPAGAVWFCEPSPCRTNTNGLASGNHREEATLHALYELIERDAIAGLFDGGELVAGRGFEVVDPASIEAPALRGLLAKLEAAATTPVILAVSSPTGIPTCWAILINREPFAPMSALNFGYGAHLDASVAVARALTEAVQSRLTMIHGARDDIPARPVYAGHVGQRGAGPRAPLDAAREFFEALDATSDLRRAPPAPRDLRGATQEVLARLRAAGHDRVYRVALRCPIPELSVVRVVAPTLRFNPAIM